MKKLLQLIAFLAIPVFASSQNCGQALHDDYSNPSQWTHIGDGTNNVFISGGVCNFNHVFDGRYDKLVRSLSFTMSQNYWNAEFKFSITSPNSVGYGASAILFAATAGNLDFWGYDSTQNFSFTSQDGIAAHFVSVSSSDNDINNWQFVILAKKGVVLAVSPTGISADSAITTYFIRLERKSTDTAQLSVFTDSLFSKPLPGSPITFGIDATIAGLNYIQQGANTTGYYTRELSATIDNLNICDAQFAGIANVEEGAGFNLYPNPSGDIINLSLPAINSSVDIYNVMGEKVYQGIEVNGKIEIDVSHYDAGLYFIRTITANEYRTAKFMVQH